MNYSATEPYQNKIQALLLDLGITTEVLGQRALAPHLEPETLVEVPRSDTAQDPATPNQLTPQTCRAWLAMQQAARAEGVPLALVSAYRSVERQREIITSTPGPRRSTSEIGRAPYQKPSGSA